MMRVIWCIVILIPSLLLASQDGHVIALAGLSGSGKTTLAKNLEKLCGCPILLEPEESEWPLVVTDNRFGYFSMWMGLRQIWLPLQFQAQQLKKDHPVVLLDSYFIKIIGYELEKPGMEWLFPKTDPYYSVYKQVCELDIQQLPDPDCIVLIDVAYADWLQLLASRNRQWDQTPGFVESYAQTRSAIREAVVQLCEERNISLIHFRTEFGDPIEQAQRLQHLLVEEKILSGS